MNNYLLPIGTIVKLKNSTESLMIIGRFPIIKKNNITGYYDYNACLYPDGFYGNNLYMFNHKDIEEIIYYGYFSLEEMDLTNHISENIDNLSNYYHFNLDE